MQEEQQVIDVVEVYEKNDCKTRFVSKSLSYI